MASHYVDKVPLTVFGISLKPLRARQRLFLIEYLKSYNASEAARNAGYKQAPEMGAKLLRNKQINRILEKVQRKVSRETDLTLEEVRRRLALNVFRNLKDLVAGDGTLISDLNELPDEASAYVDGVKGKVHYDEAGNIVGREVEYKLSPNASAQDMAMKATGGYLAEKHEHIHGVDWDTLLEGSEVIDEVEVEIKKVEGGE